MDSPQQGWLTPYRDALTTLAGRPLSLFLLLFALHSIAVPYRGFAHDAQLYALQVANQLEPGAYGDDLFLKYGSQDQFSLFSNIVAPLARLFGLSTAFFLVYLLSKALYLYALQRLLLTLIGDRPLAVVALIALAVSPLAFGGFQVFHVAEAFLTPRPIACAFTLFGLERTLRRHPAQALALFLVGMAFHPLMAVGGVALLVLLWLPGRISSGLVIAGTIAVVVVLAIPALAGKLFGSMDAQWLAMTPAATPYNFPLDWTAVDWLRTFAALAIVAGASWLPGLRPELARLYRLLAVLALGGLVATTVASEQGYALLLQVQPYRLLWLVHVLQIPLAVTIVCHWWQTGKESRRFLALALLTFLSLQMFIVQELVLVVLLAPLCAVIHRGLDKTPKRPDWVSHSLAWSLLLGLLGWTVFKVGLTLTFLPRLHGEADGLNMAYLLMTSVGVLGWLVVTLPLVRRALAPLAPVLRGEGTGVRGALKTPSPPSPLPRSTEGEGGNAVLWTSGIVIVAVSVTMLILPTTDVYRHHLRPHDDDTHFVAKTLANHRTPGQKRPTVYWGLGQPHVVWLEVGAANYYERQQLAGSLFQRQTALEGQRRIDLVQPFEIERISGKKEVMPSLERRRAEMLYGSSEEPSAPTREDFERLCRDSTLDFIVLPHDYGRSLANNGRLFVYDCRQLRARADSSTKAE